MKTLLTILIIVFVSCKASGQFVVVSETKYYRFDSTKMNEWYMAIHKKDKSSVRLLIIKNDTILISGKDTMRVPKHIADRIKGKKRK